MKRTMLVLVIVLLVISFIGVAMASDSYVISEYSGVIEHGSATIVDNSYGWRSAPKDPQTVYIAVWVPKPYDKYVENALVRVVRSNNLTPVVVENVSKYDLKGRVVLVYIPAIGKGSSTFYTERSVSGILYYSYAGDAKSAVEVINNGTTWSINKIDGTAQKFCHASIDRLMKLRIANQTCGVAYWWNLKARVGRLSNKNPYEMIASEIASQLDQLLKGS
ncbi:hypothetical protein [Thermococcus sp.]